MKFQLATLALAFLSQASALISTDGGCLATNEDCSEVILLPCDTAGDAALVFDDTVVDGQGSVSAANYVCPKKQISCMGTGNNVPRAGVPLKFSVCVTPSAVWFFTPEGYLIAPNARDDTDLWCIANEAGVLTTQKCDGDVDVLTFTSDPPATVNIVTLAGEGAGGEPATMPEEDPEMPMEENTGDMPMEEDTGDMPMEEDPSEVPMALPANVVEVIKGSENHTTLAAAVGSVEGLAAALMSVNDTFTVFAPTDAAFEMSNATKMYTMEGYEMHLADILSYHVILDAMVLSTDLRRGGVEMANGEEATVAVRPSPMVDEANIVTADIKADNGVVHVIDAVLTPSWVEIDLVTALGDTPEFSTLAGLAVDLNLTAALMGGPFTVFAPTNDAFEAAMLTGEEDLETILLNHVYSGIVTSESVMTGDMLMMAGGASITYTEVALNVTSGEEVMMDGDVVIASAMEDAEVIPVAKIGGATIIDGDYLVNNGVIHVIDMVILPEGGDM